MAREYDEIELRIEPAPADAYVVRATTSDGVAEAPFALPFTRDRRDYLILKAAFPRRGTRRIESSALREVTELGDGLFRALFHGEVRDLYRIALASADREGKGLRVKLSMTDAPEFASLPWEFLFDDPSFLAISQLTPVVRYLDLARTRHPQELKPPLRVLAMVSSPTDAGSLDAGQERDNLEQALKQLMAEGAVELHWLEQATLPALLEKLREQTFHIFHYIGHGAYKPELQDGFLLLEDDLERGREVSSQRIGTVLHDHDSLRLAVLNACEGARSSEEDPFAGVAVTLIQQGIPAVIAMQFEITDRAAIVFARDLYYALAEGLPIDAALAEARKGIWADDNDVEWGTPVLFMRTSDGRLFDVKREAEAHSDSSTATAMESGRRDAAVLVPAPVSRPPPAPPARNHRRVVVAAAAAAILLGALVLAVTLRTNTSSTAGWTSASELPESLEGAAAAQFDGRLWVIGGISGSGNRPILDRVDVYDSGTRHWTAGPSLPVALYYAAVAQAPGRLFVLGGFSATGSVDTVYELDSPTGQWRLASRLPSARGGGAAAWDGSRIVFGGGKGTDHQAHDDVWVFEGEQWRPLGLLKPARFKLASVTDLNGSVWFLAGSAGQKDSGAVDLAQEESVRPAGTVTAVQGPAAVWWPHVGMCLIGGQGNRTFTSRIECPNSRATLPAIPSPRAGLAATVVNNTVYVAGGYDGSTHGTRAVDAFATRET